MKNSGIGGGDSAAAAPYSYFGAHSEEGGKKEKGGSRNSGRSWDTRRPERLGTALGGGRWVHALHGVGPRTVMEEKGVKNTRRGERGRRPLAFVTKHS